MSLNDAARRIDQALGLLEAAVARRLATERSRADLETELQIMQDDRARLAVELEGAQARLARLESAAAHVGERLHRAIGAVREVVGEADSAS